MSRSSGSQWSKWDKMLVILCTLIKKGSVNWTSTSSVLLLAGGYCEDKKTINHNDGLEILEELEQDGIISHTAKPRGKLLDVNLWRVHDIDMAKQQIMDLVQNTLGHRIVSASLLKKIEEFL